MITLNKTTDVVPLHIMWTKDIRITLEIWDKVYTLISSMPTYMRIYTMMRNIKNKLITK